MPTHAAHSRAHLSPLLPPLDPRSSQLLVCVFVQPQAERFCRVRGLVNVTNPDTGELSTVLHVDVATEKEFACGTFSSCNGTGHVREEPELQNCSAFFNFQGGAEAISTGHMYIDFNFTVNDTAALAQPVYSCCSFNLSLSPPPPFQPLPPPAAGAANVSCPCRTCLGMCAGGSCGTGAAACTCCASPTESSSRRLLL